MKATGIVRKVDELGRLVIPKELRRIYSINEGDPVEIFTGENETIILRKYVPNETPEENIGRVITAIKIDGHIKQGDVVIEKLQKAIALLMQKNSQPAGTDCEL